MQNPPIQLGDPQALRQLLISRGAPDRTDDESLLRIARSPDHKLAITVLSALESAGRELSQAQQAELQDNRRRIARYREAWSVISAVAPKARLVKGPTIAAFYPAGLLRSAGDLDVICPQAELWLAARALIDDGWQVGTFTVLPAAATAPVGSTGQAGPGGEDDCRWHILVELSQPSDSDVIDEAYGVELRTVEVATTLRATARRTGGPLASAAANVFALVAERWERPFRSRDIFDLAVLSERLDAAERGRLRAALTATGLWPEMRELARLLRRSGLRPAPDLPGSRWLAWRSRAVRLASAVALWSSPVRILGILSVATVDADHGTLADRLAQVVQQRIGSWRLLRRGLPLFGVPLLGGPQAEAAQAEAARAEAARSSGLPANAVRAEAAQSSGLPANAVRLERRGAHVLAFTPVGAFLMVAGSCPQNWLTEAAGGLAVATS